MNYFKLLGLIFLSVLIGSNKPVAAQGKSSNYPEFSWDKIPQYIHIRKAATFTDDECKFLAGFPLITLKITSGFVIYGSGTADGCESDQVNQSPNEDSILSKFDLSL